MMANRPCPICESTPTLRAIARKFGVTPPAVLYVVDRRVYQDLDDPNDPASPAVIAENARMDAAGALLARQGVDYGHREMLRFASKVVEAVRREDRAQMAGAEIDDQM